MQTFALKGSSAEKPERLQFCRFLPYCKKKKNDSRLSGVIVQVRVVFRNTVVSDWRFE